MADTKPGDSGNGGNNNLERYWKHGPGAAKIRWGTPGDWTRCHAHLAKYVGAERAKRICAQWVKDTTGHWNAEEFGKNPLGRG